MKINILFVIYKFYLRGAEKLVYDLAKNIDKTKYNVTILSIYKSDDLNLQNSIIENLKEHNVKVELFNATREKKITCFRIILELYKFLKNNSIDIIHSHSYFPNFYSRVAGKLARKKVIVTYHSITDWNNARAFAIEKILTNFQYMSTAVSSKTVNQYIKHFGMNKVPKLIENGVDVESFNPIIDIEKYYRELNVNNGDIIILNVASVVEWKNQDKIIKAVALLKNEGINNITIMFAGGIEELEYFNSMKEYIEKHKLHDKIKFLGARNDIPQLLKLCDLFIFPSRFEAQGIALLEAMASSKAIIATDIDVFRTILNNGENSLLFAKDDYRDLASKIKLILSDRNMSGKISNQAYKDVKKFDIHNILDKYMRFYK